MKQPPYILSICGKHEINRFHNSAVTHLLSIEDPGTPKATPIWFNGPHLQLLVHDLDTPEQAAALRGILPEKDHVRQILQVGENCLKAAEIDPGRTHLLVHCYAGISRSTAAAFALTVQAVGVKHAREALEFVLQTRPEAFPNPLIVRHADRLLKGEGKLMAALKPLREQFSRAIDQWMSKDGSRPD